MPKKAYRITVNPAAFERKLVGNIENTIYDSAIQIAQTSEYLMPVKNETLLTHSTIIDDINENNPNTSAGTQISCCKKIPRAYIALERKNALNIENVSDKYSNVYA
jgi:hypothetical protein